MRKRKFWQNWENARKEVGKAFKWLLICSVGMLLLEHFVPEMVAKLPGVHKWTSSIIIPLTNWFAGVTANIVTWIAHLPGIKQILGLLASLAA